jgi:hypothetical protein
MLFFKKKPHFTPELLSLHIPKTAGTSFRNILKEQYGELAVVRLDIHENGRTLCNEIPYLGPSAPSAKVLHGHFYYHDIYRRFDLPANLKIITWLRDPVERVISNYYYLEAQLIAVLKEEKRNLNILSKMQRSLLEYAREEINRNRQYKFLEGSNLEDFAFVGIQEDFQEDLLALGKVLQWQHPPRHLHQNKTPKQRPPLSSEIREEIAQLNALDLELYQRALTLRGKIQRHA